MLEKSLLSSISIHENISIAYAINIVHPFVYGGRVRRRVLTFSDRVNVRMGSESAETKYSQRDREV
jgi:hypothetical protein